MWFLMDVRYSKHSRIFDKLDNHNESHLPVVGHISCDQRAAMISLRADSGGCQLQKLRLVPVAGISYKVPRK